MTNTRIRTRRYRCVTARLRRALQLGIVAISLFPLASFASPLLRCQINQGGNERVLDFLPISDPYRALAININNRFRFKAVVIGDTQHVDYIKLYVFAQTKRQPKLLHQVTFIAPTPSQDPALTSLTGTNYVYAPHLERELQYSCALLEKTS